MEAGKNSKPLRYRSSSLWCSPLLPRPPPPSPPLPSPPAAEDAASEEEKPAITEAEAVEEGGPKTSEGAYRDLYLLPSGGESECVLLGAPAATAW